MSLNNSMEDSQQQLELSQSSNVVANSITDGLTEEEIKMWSLEAPEPRETCRSLYLPNVILD